MQKTVNRVAELTATTFHRIDDDGRLYISPAIREWAPVAALGIDSVFDMEGGLDECISERRAAAVHRRLARDRAIAEPRGPQRARVAGFGDAILLHHDGDVVAGAPAAEAGHVLDAPLLDAHAVLAFGPSMAR